jgi:hypothetical protein
MLLQVEFVFWKEKAFKANIQLRVIIRWVLYPIDNFVQKSSWHRLALTRSSRKMLKMYTHAPNSKRAPWRQPEQSREPARLSTFCLVVHPKGPTTFVWTIRHALYDSLTVALVSNYVQSVSTGMTSPKPVAYNHFIRWIQGLDNVKHILYSWSLENYRAPAKARSYQRSIDVWQKRGIE